MYSHALHFSATPAYLVDLTPLLQSTLQPQWTFWAPVESCWLRSSPWQRLFPLPHSYPLLLHAMLDFFSWFLCFTILCPCIYLLSRFLISREIRLFSSPMSPNSWHIKSPLLIPAERKQEFPSINHLQQSISYTSINAIPKNIFFWSFHGSLKMHR